jgi:uncharacterized DUF497 family protein
MIEFTWDARKARRNERDHGISFAAAQTALESRLGVEIEEQFREDEWRTIVIAPLHGILLLHITIAFYPRGEDEGTSIESDEEARQHWRRGEGTVRIISARKAEADEQALYFTACAQTLG